MCCLKPPLSAERRDDVVPALNPLEGASARVLRGLALEVRDLVGLGVGPLLCAAELVLGVALALFLPALAAQARVVREGAGGLLRTAGQLVNDSLLSPPLFRTWSVPVRDSAHTGRAARPALELRACGRRIEVEQRRVVRRDPR